MRNLSAAILVGAMAFAIGVNAQTPQQQPDPNQTITVTGCVQQQTDVLKRPAVPGKVGMGDEFVLTRSAVRIGAPATEPPPQTPPTPPETEPGKIYRVTGDKEAELKAHLGHRVEITGKFKNEADARRELGAIGTSGKPPANAPEPTDINTPEITIDSFRMLSATCGG
jgi:hypothetical protein